MRRLTGFVLLGAVVVPACKGGGEDLPEAVTLDIVASSNEQQAPAGARLAAPLAVVARASDGTAVPRARVRWTIVDGSGAALSDTLTLSDGTGTAEVAFTLGPTPGEYRVRGKLTTAEESAVVLVATATDPPTIAALMPASFGGGDTVTAMGTSLSAVERVDVENRNARLLSATATELRFIAPVCLVPGPVQVRARHATGATNAATATYAAAAGPIRLLPGEYVSIEPAQLATCATFDSAGPAGAEYLVAPQSVTGSPGVSVSFRLAGDSVVVSLTAREREQRDLPAAVRFHDAIRAEERAAARRPRAPRPPTAAAQVPIVRVKIGDRRSFQVCRDLPCSAVGDFDEATAAARWVGNHAAIFIDESAPPAGFTDADLDSLGTLFDRELYDVDTRAFGAESDIDQNGAVIILLTPLVNRLTAATQCATSIITGYFFGVDIDPVFQGDPRSNRGEVFYALAPDPQGTVTCELSRDLVRRLVPVTFVHEFQHMISYSQHVVHRGGNSEVLWLNEALSHLAEELAALRFEARGDNVLFSRFAVGDLFNAYLYLLRPGDFFVLPSEGTGTLEERGGAWLFLRWLVDQYGDRIIRRLVETSQTGAVNIENVIGEPLAALLSEWFLANYVSDLPSFTAPDRLRFTTWRLRTTFQSFHDQQPMRFTKPFPIEPPIQMGGTFAFTGTLRAGSGEYFLVRQAANGRSFTLNLEAPGGGPLGGTAVPRLNVIRLR